MITKFYKKISIDYEFNDLEPVIFFRSFRYHYFILSQQYADDLNEIINIFFKNDEDKPGLTELLKEEIDITNDKKKNENIRFLAGGLFNHNFFFKGLCKKEKNKNNEEKINPDLLSLVEECFSDLENLKRELIKNYAELEGSGWTWLVLNKKNKLEIINTKDNKTPCFFLFKPLMVIDAWEHVFLWDYGFKKVEFAKNLLDNIINWQRVNKLFLKYYL